jgi:signal transduction histidine kinase
MALLTRQEAQTGESLMLNALWGATRIFRWLALGYAAWGDWIRHDEMANPSAAAAILFALGVWTAYMWVADPRTLGVLLFELVLVAAAVYSTRWVDSYSAAVEGQTTVVGVWAAVPVVALAVLLGWRGGLAASLVMTVVMVAMVGRVDSEPVSNAGLLIMLGGCLGFGADLARREQRALRDALARQAEAAERDRLARTVHDGVLQALAFIHRRGLDLGGEAAKLGAMAAGQEARLRALVSGVPLRELEDTVGGPVDLRRALEAVVTERATLVPPADPVVLPQQVASEVSAAVEAALENVRQHAGADALAWVLIDDRGSDVVVTVRDNGIGVTQERIEEASGWGRLGVSSSIKGRIEELGGRATYVYGLGVGTTVEMWIPKGKG